MPYITNVRRNEIDDILGANVADLGRICVTAGDLNYVFSVIALNYFRSSAHGGTYQAINDIVGALEGAKLEFYRRVAAPYEDTKIVANGDVYKEA